MLVIEESGDETPQLPPVRPQGTIGVEDVQSGIAEGTGEPLGDLDWVRLVPLLRDNQRRCDHGCERSDIGDRDLGGDRPYGGRHGRAGQCPCPALRPDPDIVPVAYPSRLVAQKDARQSLDIASVDQRSHLGKASHRRVASRLVENGGQEEDQPVETPWSIGDQVRQRAGPQGDTDRAGRADMIG